MSQKPLWKQGRQNIGKILTNLVLHAISDPAIHDEWLRHGYFVNIDLVGAVLHVYHLGGDIDLYLVDARELCNNFMNGGTFRSAANSLHIELRANQFDCFLTGFLVAVLRQSLEAHGFERFQYMIRLPSTIVAM